MERSRRKEGGGSPMRSRRLHMLYNHMGTDVPRYDGQQQHHSEEQPRTSHEESPDRTYISPTLRKKRFQLNRVTALKITEEPRKDTDHPDPPPPVSTRLSKDVCPGEISTAELSEKIGQINSYKKILQKRVKTEFTPRRSDYFRQESNLECNKDANIRGPQEAKSAVTGVGAAKLKTTLTTPFHSVKLPEYPSTVSNPKKPRHNESRNTISTLRGPRYLESWNTVSATICPKPEDVPNAVVKISSLRPEEVPNTDSKSKGPRRQELANTVSTTRHSRPEEVPSLAAKSKSSRHQKPPNSVSRIKSPRRQDSSNTVSTTNRTATTTEALIESTPSTGSIRTQSRPSGDSNAKKTQPKFVSSAVSNATTARPTPVERATSNVGKAQSKTGLPSKVRSGQSKLAPSMVKDLEIKNVFFEKGTELKTAVIAVSKNVHSKPLIRDVSNLRDKSIKAKPASGVRVVNSNLEPSISPIESEEKSNGKKATAPLSTKSLAEPFTPSRPAKPKPAKNKPAGDTVKLKRIPRKVEAPDERPPVKTFKTGLVRPLKSSTLRTTKFVDKIASEIKKSKLAASFQVIPSVQVDTVKPTVKKKSRKQIWKAMDLSRYTSETVISVVAEETSSEEVLIEKIPVKPPRKQRGNKTAKTKVARPKSTGAKRATKTTGAKLKGESNQSAITSEKKVDRVSHGKGPTRSDKKQRPSKVKASSKPPGTDVSGEVSHVEKSGSRKLDTVFHDPKTQRVPREESKVTRNERPKKPQIDPIMLRDSGSAIIFERSEESIEKVEYVDAHSPYTSPVRSRIRASRNSRRFGNSVRPNVIKKRTNVERGNAIEGWTLGDAGSATIVEESDASISGMESRSESSSSTSSENSWEYNYENYAASRERISSDHSSNRKYSDETLSDEKKKEELKEVTKEVAKEVTHESSSDTTPSQDPSFLLVFEEFDAEERRLRGRERGSDDSFEISVTRQPARTKLDVGTTSTSESSKYKLGESEYCLSRQYSKYIDEMTDTDTYEKKEPDDDIEECVAVIHDFRSSPSLAESLEEEEGEVEHPHTQYLQLAFQDYLTRALADICLYQPRDPIEYLALWIKAQKAIEAKAERTNAHIIDVTAMRKKFISEEIIRLEEERQADIRQKQQIIEELDEESTTSYETQSESNEGEENLDDEEQTDADQTQSESEIRKLISPTQLDMNEPTTYLLPPEQ